MRPGNHDEEEIDSFDAADGTIVFYGFVRAIQLKHGCRSVLDFGAGRGSFWFDDPSTYRRSLRDLRTSDNHVTACDVDPVVRSHPCSHEQSVVTAGASLPFEDESFDLIVSDMTFEHIDDPELVANELTRLLQPGGYLCVRTPNRFGYPSLVAALVPNSLHARVLRRIQPSRKSHDIFPTYFRLNTPRQVRKHFASLDVVHVPLIGRPSYYANSRMLYRLLSALHRVLPNSLAPAMCVFMRKAPPTSSGA